MFFSPWSYWRRRGRGCSWFAGGSHRLREQVKLAWSRLEADQSNEAVKSVYNKHVAMYNDALDGFPANLVGPAAGFKSAKHFFFNFSSFL